MKADELFRLGKIVRTFGSKGELMLQVEAEEFAGIKKLESVFVELNHNLIPFFIESLQSRPKNQFLVKFMDIETVEDADELTGCQAYAPKSLLPAAKKKKIISNDFSGYAVIDSVHNEVGVLRELLEMPQQTLMAIEKEGKEILIPVVEEFILDIDHKKKIIYTQTPEGLIELYL